jgi:hypothetical protein
LTLRKSPPETPSCAGLFSMEPTGIEPVTSCMQNDYADPP